jgi:hypothetical protein
MGRDRATAAEIGRHGSWHETRPFQGRVITLPTLAADATLAKNAHQQSTADVLAMMALARRNPTGELWIVDGNRIRFRQGSWSILADFSVLIEATGGYAKIEPHSATAFSRGADRPLPAAGPVGI